MPDYGRPAEELERGLEASLAIYPVLDYGSALLAGNLPSHPPSGGRRLNGGIMMRPGYRGPTVNIRPPKWADTTFWIRADNYPDAQYIADAVYYHIGRGPFHFCDANFEYPPLRLATCELLSRAQCSAYAESIAKGPALQKKREDYRERVKELVLKAVKSPEAVLFLSSLRPVAQPGTNLEATEETEIVHDGIEEESHLVGLPAEEDAGNNIGDECTEQGTPMEVDDASERAVLSLDLSPSDVPETVDPTGGLAYIPSFGIDRFDDGNILRSDCQSLGVGWSRFRGKEEEHTTPSNLKDLVITLDRVEEELWRLTKNSDWTQFGPHPNILHYTLRYNRGLPPPYPDWEAL